MLTRNFRKWSHKEKHKDSLYLYIWNILVNSEEKN